MKSHRNNYRTLVCLAAAGFTATGAQAVGFRLPNQDPDAIARGNAFVATADNPSAIYYNPAGITQLQGQNVRAGVYAVVPGIDYKSPSGQTANVKSELSAVPQLYYVYAPQDFPLAFGLGVYAPYGLSLDWGKDTPFRSEAERGSLTYLTINPVVAWKVTKTLSLGIGPTINYSSAMFEQGIGLVPNDALKVDGSGWGYGFNAGVRWQPLEKWAFGLNYRYLTTVDYSGSSETHPSPPFPHGTTDATASIRFPQFIVGGVSFRPTPDWNLEFDLDWTDWDNVNSIPINHTPLGNTALLLNYRSSFMYEFGVTRQLGKGYFASVGYFYSENSSPDHDFNPIIPDTALHLGSVGFGHKGVRWDWTVAYHFGFNPGRDVTADKTYPLANGNYSVFNNAVNVAVTYKF